MNSTPTGSDNEFALRVTKASISRHISEDGHYNRLNLYSDNGLLSLHLTPSQTAAIFTSGLYACSPIKNEKDKYLDKEPVDEQVWEHND